MKQKTLIAGNWKMNGDLQWARATIANLTNDIYNEMDVTKNCEFVVFPPDLYTYIIRHAVRNIPYMSWGAQNCSAFDDGAHTGEASAAMLKDSECEYVIVGHSERRTHLGENDADINAKAAQVHAQDLKTIICIGESQDDRDTGDEFTAVEKQLLNAVPKSANGQNTVIAYEPVWAIGTGKTPSADQIEQMHSFIREKLKDFVADSGDMRIVYGGSVIPENADEILSLDHVNGALIGGASLDAGQFLKIALAAPKL